MKMKVITKAIALTLCASMIMGTPTENFAKAQGSAAETKQDEKKDSAEVTWNLKAIEADRTDKTDGNLAGQGSKIRIAILDSGVDYSESVNVVERKDFLGEDISPLYEDSTGHGTAIASVIASDGSNESIKGINPDVEIYSAKILDNNNKASIDRVVKAIDWAIEKKVNIINMSFGRSYDSAAMHKAIKRAKKAGILMFASAGNLGNGRKVEYPAAYKEVVAVGASSVDGNLSEVTNDGDELELLAPGEAIKSTGWLDMECISNGTSFSVPHAVGVASLLWQKDTAKSAEFIRNLMKTSAKHIENNGRDYLLIDYEYACKIYDDYNEQYSEKDYFVEFEDEFQNNSEVEDYSGEVEGRWSIEDHKETVDNCYERINSDFEDAAIVKIGVAAPDRFCSYAIHPSHQMFHAISNDRDHNYVRVCEYIMNMATYCKKYGHAATLSANCKPDNANDSDYNTVKSWLGPAEIDFMLKNSANGVYAYNDKNAALVMLGIAMHVMGDTYSHQSREKINGKYEKLKKEKRDIKEKIPQRYSCAKESMLNLWTNYYNNIKTNGTDFEVVGTKFRLNKLYTYSINSTNGKSKSWSSFKDLKGISCND